MSKITMFLTQRGKNMTVQTVPLKQYQSAYPFHIRPIKPDSR